MIFNRTTKLRWRRRVRRSRQQAQDIGQQTEVTIERHLIRRLSRLWYVRRFLWSWVILVTVLVIGLTVQIRGLSAYYQHIGFIPGGTYTEGVLGSFTNANPLYASGPVDGSVSRLIFASLLKYDSNNNLAAGLAQKWSVNDRGTVYTVLLRPDLKWQDGRLLTADDVVFTYQTIQNPDAKSVLFNSWKGVQVAKVDDRTVTFTLPSPLSSFPYSLTNGIVPKHKLDSVPPGQLRSIAFNTVAPVGAGPFKWDRIEVTGTTPGTREERIALTPNESYVDGKPKLDRFVIRAFHDQKQMIKSFGLRELTAMAGLERMPEELGQPGLAQEYSMPLTSATMVFLKTTGPILSDVAVRKALVLGASPAEAVADFGYPVKLVREPLLRGDVGYDNALAQQTGTPTAAKQILDQAGWVPDPKTGVRSKAGQRLEFTLVSENTAEYTAVTHALQKQWKDIGVNAQVVLQPTVDLQTTFIVPHNYDALLYGISLGVDPDVFAYWHSSQADILSPTRLNFSEYKSTAADRALEAGRSRLENPVRAIKYHPFLDAWRNDAPALALYQPRFLYITRGPVGTLTEHTINSGPDRYNSVEQWMTRQTLVNN